MVPPCSTQTIYVGWLLAQVLTTGSKALGSTLRCQDAFSSWPFLEAREALQAQPGGPRGAPGSALFGAGLVVQDPVRAVRAPENGKRASQFAGSDDVRR